jgi:hypothetical protein
MLWNELAGFLNFTTRWSKTFSSNEREYFVVVYYDEHC